MIRPNLALVALLLALATHSAWAAPVPAPADAMVPVTWTAVPTPRGGTLLLRVGAATVDVRFPSLDDANSEGPRLASRLGLLAATRSSLGEVAAGTVNEAGVLLWRGRIVLMVTRAQARQSGEEPLQVVSRWAAALRRARATGRPGSLPRTVGVPEGESRVVALPAAWAGAAVSTSDPDVMLAVPVGKGRNLLLRGRGTGVAVLTLVKGKGTASFEVRVREKAGAIPASVTVALAGAGSLDDGELALDALQRALEQSCQPRPGAWLEPYWQGAAGRTAAGARVTAWLEGPGLAPVVASVAVRTVACSAAFARPDALAASNHPERLESDQVLLNEPLGAGNSVYYYHHQNVTRGPRRALEVRLENRTARPMSLLVTQSGAGPSPDELYAGHIATWRYLRWMTAGRGWQVRIPSGGAYLLDRRLLGEREVGCGMGQVMVLEGAPPNLVVEAYATGPTEYAGTGEDLDPVVARPPVESVRGRGLFPRPEKEITETYRSGGRHLFVAVGAPPYQESLTAGGSPNVGNYGVEHRIRLVLENPTAAPERVYLVFSVRGGLARGSLLVDDRLIETPMLSTKQGGMREFGLGQYDLQPGERREINVLAFPEPGSNYPIWLIVRPQPANS